MSETPTEDLRKTQSEQRQLARDERTEAVFSFGLGAVLAGLTVALARHPTALNLFEHLTPSQLQTADQDSTVGAGVSATTSAFSFGWGFLRLNVASWYAGRETAIEGALVAHELANPAPSAEQPQAAS